MSRRPLRRPRRRRAGDRGQETLVQAAPVVETREARLFATVATGLSESQVIAILGQPTRTSFQGGLKKVYEYQSGKVIFADGDVTEVQPGAVAAGYSPMGAAPATMGASSVGASSDFAPAAAAPRSQRDITAGMTESEVISILGRPLRVSFQGGVQKVYEYTGRKVIFVDGNVSDVQ